MFGTLATKIAPAIVSMALGQFSPPGQPAQPALDVVYSHSRSQSVDANFPESRRAEIRELLLFSSRNNGENWDLVARTTPESGKFAFTLPTEGLHWLRVAVVNRAGNQEPSNLYKVQPNWKLMVDTIDPLIRISSASRQGSEVALAWEIQEDNPEWTTFKIEYQSPGGAPTTVQGNVTPGLTGQARFTPNTNGPITVRVSLRDKTGHTKSESVEVAGRDSFGATASATELPPPVAPAPPAPITSNSAAPIAPPVAPVTPPNTLPIIPSTPVMPTPPPQPALETPPPVQQAPVQGTPIPGNPNAQNFGPPPGTRQLPPAPQYGKQWVSTNPKDFQSQPLGPKIASTDDVQVAQYQPTPAAPSPGPRRALPPLQYLNSPDVMLEYELSKVGPSGVGSVDIYLTQDDGQTWDHVARDNKVVGKTTGGRHHGICELPGDGIYGFTLIVKSQAQMRQEMTKVDQKPRVPKTGDVPEIRVEVDTVAPTAELFEPRRDPSKANALMLIWTAQDKNLGPTPITLEWGERREGPWFPIAASIANTGSHSWTLPDRLPVQVYMRLRVKDLANNEGVAVTLEPQLVDLSEPEGRLVNVSGAPPRR